MMTMKDAFDSSAKAVKSVAEMGDMPCLDAHQMASSVPCDGIMSLSDCAHLDSDAVLGAATGGKLLGVDNIPAEQLITATADSLFVVSSAPRAPPSLYSFSLSQTKLLSITQRFRL